MVAGCDANDGKSKNKKKLENITIIIIIIIYVVMVLMMGLHWRSKWATHTVAGCWLSLPMPCHHDCIPPVISKIYFITTVYHQPSQKDISSWLYTSHHLDIPVVVISSQLYTSCKYFIPTIYWYTIVINISSQQYYTSHRCFTPNIPLIEISSRLYNSRRYFSTTIF